jgi:hypothetical protein
MMRAISSASDTVAERIFIGASCWNRRWCAAMKPYVICPMCTTSTAASFADEPPHHWGI